MTLCAMHHCPRYARSHSAFCSVCAAANHSETTQRQRSFFDRSEADETKRIDAILAGLDAKKRRERRWVTP